MAPSQAQVSIAIGVPGLSIGINVPVFPDLVPVPGYPVYYYPGATTNYFFYDGLYWVFQGDSWYQSSWYDGPWQLVEPEYVPVYVLRVPVRYYRYPPVYFRGWRYDEPPRWGDHWGPDWEARRRGWDHWNHNAVPAAAPLPVYQRQYAGHNYPRTVEQQRNLGEQHYHYQPHDAYARQNLQGAGHPANPPGQYRPAPEQQRPPSPPQGNPGRPPEPPPPGRTPAPPRPQQITPNAPWQRPHEPPQGQPPGQPWQQPSNPGRQNEPHQPGPSQNQPWSQQGNPGHQHGEPHQAPPGQSWQQQGGNPGRPQGEPHQQPPGQQRSPNYQPHPQGKPGEEHGEQRQQGDEHQRPPYPQ